MEASELVQRFVSRMAEGQPIHTASRLLDELREDLIKIGRRSAFFESQGLPLQEAWVGIKFGEIMTFDTIYLAAKAQMGFDVVLLKDNVSVQFDITEATDRNVDRAEEYRSGPEMIVEDSGEIARQESLFEKNVGNRLKRKSSDNLIVYVNTGWLPEEKFIEDALIRWHLSFKKKFNSAYLLIRGSVVQLAPELQKFSNSRSRENGPKS
ncbi:hypothetical protein K1X12_08120 [Hyphomonas sp. WL0036]|uniref:hypothetical protein n=1 Tax=Hyphomonas sediminis TaxID=2866160 RepID=UPI001C81A518|nr:hypothetical protein [Hyphomonas sediminis]MBY9066863.1 hypothetical protein [Hyphomonas sediminis]